MSMFFARRRPLLRAATFGRIGAVAASPVRRRARGRPAQGDLGPVQILVIGYTDEPPIAQLLLRLRGLRRRGLVRLLDLVLVSKDDDGLVTQADHDNAIVVDGSSERSLAAALLGFGPRGVDGSWPALDLLGGTMNGRRDGRTWVVADAIPPGTSAAVALIEHRWAIPLRDAAARGGGVALEDTWVHPADLLAAGLVLDGVDRPAQVDTSSPAALNGGAGPNGRARR